MVLVQVPARKSTASSPCAASAREQQAAHRRVPHPEVLQWWKRRAEFPYAACAPGPLAGVSSAAPAPRQPVRRPPPPVLHAAMADSRPFAVSSPGRPLLPESPGTARQSHSVQGTGPRPGSRPVPAAARLAPPVPPDSQSRPAACQRRRRRRRRQAADPAELPVSTAGIRPYADVAGLGQPRCSRWSSCLSPPGRSFSYSRSGRALSHGGR